MTPENERPRGQESESAKPFEGDEKSRVAIFLPDDALAPHGFERGRKVEVELGPVWQGDLGAILDTRGNWYVGYLFLAQCGVNVFGALTGRPPRYVPLDSIAAHGPVVSYHSRPLTARKLLPACGVDSIRYRFKL
jgi:hypothetical protein